MWNFFWSQVGLGVNLVEKYKSLIDENLRIFAEKEASPDSIIMHTLYLIDSREVHEEYKKPISFSSFFRFYYCFPGIELGGDYKKWRAEHQNIPENCEHLISYIETNFERIKKALEIRKKEAEYWFSLRGHKFEEEVSKLFLKSGLFTSVIKTKGSGDGGVDLILTFSDDTKMLVQCKAHKKEVGPHVARDLYGAMHSAGISSGLIISLGGVTQGVRDFIKGKELFIWDVNSIIKFQKGDFGLDDDVQGLGNFIKSKDTVLFDKTKE